MSPYTTLTHIHSLAIPFHFTFKNTTHCQHFLNTISEWHREDRPVRLNFAPGIKQHLHYFNSCFPTSAKICAPFHDGTAKSHLRDMLERARSHQRFNWNCTKWNKFQEQRLCYANLRLIYNLAIKALTLNVEGKLQFNISNCKFFLSKALKSFDLNCYF